MLIPYDNKIRAKMFIPYDNKITRSQNVNTI